MNRSKINTAIIALLSATAFLSGCGDEQKEAAKQTEQTTSESTPAAPLSEVAGKATEMASTGSEVVKDVTQQAVEKTTEAAQAVKSSTETAATEAVATVKEAASNVTEVVETTPEQVRKIQQALTKAGFNPGPVDGRIGPKTKAALESFQKQKNLTVGQITKETLLALGVTK